MKVEKLCNFYASKYHLGLILLEYFNLKKIKKYKTITFIQDELEKEIELIKKHYCNIDAIKDIDFKTTENIYDKEICSEKNIIFIVEGNLDYIKKANEYILDSVENSSNIKIINCHNFARQKNFMSDIINKNDKILYTTGEKVID